MNKKKELIITAIISFIALAIFVTLAAILEKNNFNIVLDFNIRDFFYSIRGEKNGFLYYLAKIISELAATYIIIFYFVFGIFYTKIDKRLIIFVMGILMAKVFNDALKETFNRARPLEENMWAIENETSFPSGHSTLAGFLYTFIPFIVLKNHKRKSIIIPVLAVSGSLLVLVPISRLVLGVHYFTDVCAGLAFGIIVTGICILLYYIFEKYDFLNKPLLNFKKVENEEDKDI